MKQKSNLTNAEQQQLSESQSNHTEAREFPTAEDAMRADASQILVPPAVTKRLNESIKNEPAPKHSWWRRLTGGA